MIAYKPVPFHLAPFHPALGQPLSVVTPPALPDPDLTFTGYTGIAGAVETVVVTAVSSAAAWAGVHVGINGKDPYLRAAGWAGGIGSALFGLLYLGAKTGVGPSLGLPAVRLSPS